MSTQFRRGGMMSRSNSGSRPLPPRQNVAVKVARYELDNPKKGSNPEKDALVGYLLHDVPEWGMVAEFGEPDEHGVREPLTEVRVLMPVPGYMDEKRAAKRRDIYALSRPKGQGAAMGEGSIVVFEKAYFSRKEGVIKADFSHGCGTKQQMEDGLKVVFPNMLVCVRPEDYIERGERKGWAGRVDVLIADPNMAELVTDMADLKTKVADLVDRSTLGNPGFQLLARKLCPEGVDPASFAADPNTRIGGYAIARRKKLGEGEDAPWVPATADDLMTRFIRDNTDRASGKFLFEGLIGNPEWQVEFVPLIAVNQAKSLVPSNKEDNEKGRDNSTIYGIYGQVVGEDVKHARYTVEAEDGRVYGMIDCGWMPSHVVCERRAADSDIWYSTYQNPMGQRLDADSIHDVRTPLTPDYHLEAIKATAALNVEGKKAYRAAAGAAAPAEEHEEAPEAPAPGR